MTGRDSLTLALVQQQADVLAMVRQLRVRQPLQVPLRCLGLAMSRGQR
jgi:hypothetical protein